MSINIKLNSQILALLNIKLLDTIFTENTEKTLTGILTRNFDNVILRHPVVSRAGRNATLCCQYGNDFTC